MKRIISLTLVFIMLLLPLGASADGTSSQDMQEVLLKLKERVDIPAELGEFSSHISKNGDRVYYNFDWANTDYSKSISVSCDSSARITSYYNSSFELSDKKLSTVSKDEIIAYAQSFLERMLPEAFENENDKLVYDEDSYDARGNLRYSLQFTRYRNATAVKDNYASITLCVAEDEIYVRNMNVSFRYGAQFAEAETSPLYREKYMETFPTELVYCDEYNYKAVGDEPKITPVLIYRIKDNNIGYIDISTGEVIEEDSDDEFRKEFGAMEDSAQNSTASGGGGSSLTEQETAEISRIEGLLSVGDIEKALKKLPYIDIPSGLTLRSSELARESDGEYVYRLYYSSEDEKNYQYFNAAVNARSGKIIRISNNSGYADKAADITLTETEIKNAEKKIAEFLAAAAKDEYAACIDEKTDSYGSSVNKHYVRAVNGIKYVDNAIRITFDAKNSAVLSYSLTFTDGDFGDCTNAIGESAAYEKILEYSPITPVYIYSGGKYVKAASLEKRGITLDALTGEIKNGYDNKSDNYNYTDVSGHWAEEAATKLAEIQVGLEGDELRPDEHITQAQLLRLMCSGIINKYYAQYTDEELYDALIREKIITEEEKSPQEAVTRENAFIYMIRLAGLERVAMLSDIYKVSYADGSSLSGGNIGYAAILSAMGVICGDGGYLRPSDSLTRAEAIMMTYRYLLTL